MFTKTPLSELVFKKLTQHIHEHMGIMLTDKKRSMLESRMGRRLHNLQLKDLNTYGNGVLNRSLPASEMSLFYDLVTTNKTDFYREPVHFDFLIKDVVSKYVRSSQASKRFKIWSAGCSEGMEAYTIGMLLSDVCKKHPHFDYRILGTDICNAALKRSRNAIYNKREIEPIPEKTRQKYLLRGKDKNEGIYKIDPAITRRCSFQTLNFMEAPYPIKSKFHVIFHRNVLIYFDKPTQEHVVRNLVDHLLPDGILFIGHAESISGFNLPLKALGPTTFQKI
ncbi:MAG: CheR family methyltransferase [Opitutales bacterium]